jgi:hypothetical protein
MSMFRKNQTHQQPALIISTIHDLPEKQRARLVQSCAGTFYREFFCASMSTILVDGFCF